MSNRAFGRTFAKVAASALLSTLAIACSGGEPEETATRSTPSSVAEPSTSLRLRRADELLAQMTVDEKVMQLSSIYPLALFTTEGTNRSQLDALLENGIGHVSALGLKMMHARATGGDIAMAGVDLGGGAPPEGRAAVVAELEPIFALDRREYLRSNYAALSLAEAVRQLLPNAEVTAVAGTGVVPSEPTDIAAAVAAARNADVVILAVGGRSAWSNERTEGEGSDTANKDLPSQQVELIRAVTRVGKPTVAVISMGGPYALASVIDELPAVITDYYGGPHQAAVLADALFGVTNPEGKLPFTVPRHVGQAPIHHAQRWGSGYRRTEGDIHHGYLDMPSTPLFAFGHGLSYTTFEYGPVQLTSDTVDVGGEARASVTVTNTGSRRGTEIVQLYAGDTATGVTLPAQQLVGFARVDLEPRASKTITFAVPMSLLAYTGLSGDVVMEPGPVEISAGSSSSDIRAGATVTVTGQARAFPGDERTFLSAATIEP